MSTERISKAGGRPGAVRRVVMALVVVCSVMVFSGLTPSPVAAAQVPVTANVSLVAGENLISLPLIPTDGTIGTILSGIVANINSVWTYDASTGLWHSWSPVLGGDITTLSDGVGYWFDMTAPATLSFTGLVIPDPPAVPPSYAVSIGWNLVGFKSQTAKTVAAYLVGTTYRVPIYGWTAAAYTTFNTPATDNFQSGSGYWVYFDAAGVITP
jgi:hypothetical protein